MIRSNVRPSQSTTKSSVASHLSRMAIAVQQGLQLNFYRIATLINFYLHFSFDCSHLDARDSSKCYYQGKVLNDRENIERETLGSACIGAASCTSSGTFIHAHIDCAEFFGPPLQEGCIRQYSRDHCCSVGTVCGELNIFNEILFNSLLRC